MQTDIVLGFFVTGVAATVLYLATLIAGLREIDNALNFRARYGRLPAHYTVLVAANTGFFIIAVIAYLIAAYKFFA
jgi:hypothetical protein